MNNKQIFENFLESLKGKGQDTLIESVKKGFQTFFESEWSKTFKRNEIKYEDLNENLKRAVAIFDVNSSYDAKMQLIFAKYTEKKEIEIYLNVYITELLMPIGKLQELVTEFKDSFVIINYTNNKLSVKFKLSEKDIDEMNLRKEIEEKTPAEPEPQPPENVS